MGLMQFTAIVLMVGLTMKLFLLPRRVEENSVTGMSRWLMLGGTALLGVQFFLQFKLGLRAMGVTQAVMLNLLMFVPSSWVFGLAVINLQRQGRLNWQELAVGGVTWALIIALLAWAAKNDGQPFFCDTPAKKTTAMTPAQYIRKTENK